MSEKTSSEINEGWILLCEEARSARYNRDTLLFSATVNQDYENAEAILNKIDERMREYRNRYDFLFRKSSSP